MTQALTNVLLMDAVVGCLQTQKPITAASKLAYFDKITHEGLESAVLLLLLFCSLLTHLKTVLIPKKWDAQYTLGKVNTTIYDNSLHIFLMLDKITGGTKIIFLTYPINLCFRCTFMLILKFIFQTTEESR